MEAVASHPDILLDLNLPDRDGFSMLAELRERNPAVSVVVLSATQDRANVMKALDLGAMGYIPKSARNEVMLSALRLVFAGGIYIPPEVLAREHLSPTAPRASGVGRAIASPADLGLTDRQLDVLALMMQGKNSVIYGTAVGGFMFDFVRFVAKSFMRLSETTRPNIAGTPSLLAAIRGADWSPQV
jgi:DNA-binding NarL/FixJ family response regulator